MAVSIMVEWGYEPHTLVLENAVWRRILNGEAITIEGDGFSYEGDAFIDTWLFSGGMDGELVVEYRLEKGGPMDEGTGFTGRLRDASIIEK